MSLQGTKGKKTSKIGKWPLSLSPVAKEMSLITAAGNFNITQQADIFTKEMKVITGTNLFIFMMMFIRFLTSAPGVWMCSPRQDWSRTPESWLVQPSRYFKKENCAKHSRLILKPCWLSWWPLKITIWRQSPIITTFTLLMSLSPPTSSSPVLPWLSASLL